MRLKDKTVFVTGAGREMGRLASEMFAAEGAEVVATDVDADALRETVESVQSGGGSIVGVECDVTDGASVRNAIAMGVRTFGRLTTLYNNASNYPDGDSSVIDTQESVFQRVIDLNLKGVWNSCKYGIPELLKAGRGSIINITPFTVLTGSSAPKDASIAGNGAIVSLTRSLAAQYGSQGIRANAVCHGPVLTQALESLLAGEDEKMNRLNRIPLGRLGRPEDVVYAALYLASDESSWTTGTAFVVDGGITANYF